MALLVGASWAVAGVARSAAVLLVGIFAFGAVLPFVTNERIWLLGNLALLGVGFAAGYFMRTWHRGRSVLVVGWLASLPIIAFLLYGGVGLPIVATDVWGGLLLTLALAIVGIAASFPLGVLLAVGRSVPIPPFACFASAILKSFAACR